MQQTAKSTTFLIPLLQKLNNIFIFIFSRIGKVRRLNTPVRRKILLILREFSRFVEQELCDLKDALYIFCTYAITTYCGKFQANK